MIVDLDAAGGVVGIEIVSLAVAEDIERARRFAATRGLPFPRDLGAAYRDLSAS